MANFPDNNTARFYVDYEGLMGKRTVQFRPKDAATQSNMITEISGLLNILKPIIYTSVTFNALRMALAGSNVSNPVTGWTPILGTAAGTHPDASWPLFISFVGRDNVGSRIRCSFYGVTISPTSDYRLNLGENTTIASAVAYLNDGARLFATVSHGTPIWKSYANQGYNAYHQRKRRAVG